MTYLVDANVLSEPTKPTPEPKVVEWLRANEAELAVDAIILGEIRFGIYCLPAGRRKTRLERWFAGGVESIVCLPVDAATGLEWARLLAGLRGKGFTMPFRDSLIAATALAHRLTVATRNTGDFKNAGVKLINPFS